MASNFQTQRETTGWSPLNKHLRRVLYLELTAIAVYGLFLHFCVWK